MAAEAHSRANGGEKSLTIHEAAKQGLLKEVINLHQQGADIDQAECGVKTYFNKSIQKYTPVFYAASEGHLAVVKYLCENGANITRKRAPMYEAAQGGHTEVLKYLFEHRANINSRGGRGTTLLMDAAKSGRLGMVRFLCAQGADVNRIGRNSQTALMNAAGRGHLDIVVCLCEHGAADVNFEPSPVNGDYSPLSLTALYIISGMGSAMHVEVIKYLCDRGADESGWKSSGDSENALEMCCSGILSLSTDCPQRNPSVVHLLVAIEYLLVGAVSKVVTPNFSQLTDLLKAGKNLVGNMDKTLEDQFCRSLMVVLLVGSQVSEKDHQLMKDLNPVLASRGIREFAADKCGRPGSLKRLSKFAVRRMVRKPLASNVLKTGLPEHLQKYLLLQIAD